MLGGFALCAFARFVALHAASAAVRILAQERVTITLKTRQAGRKLVIAAADGPLALSGNIQCQQHSEQHVKVVMPFGLSTLMR